MPLLEILSNLCHYLGTYVGAIIGILSVPALYSEYFGSMCHYGSMLCFSLSEQLVIYFFISFLCPLRGKACYETQILVMEGEYTP